MAGLELQLGARVGDKQVQTLDITSEIEAALPPELISAIKQQSQQVDFQLATDAVVDQYFDVDSPVVREQAQKDTELVLPKTDVVSASTELTTASRQKQEERKREKDSKKRKDLQAAESSRSQYTPSTSTPTYKRRYSHGR